MHTKNSVVKHDYPYIGGFSVDLLVQRNKLSRVLAHIRRMQKQYKTQLQNITTLILVALV